MTTVGYSRFGLTRLYVVICLAVIRPCFILFLNGRLAHSILVYSHFGLFFISFSLAYFNVIADTPNNSCQRGLASLRTIDD